MASYDSLTVSSTTSAAAAPDSFLRLRSEGSRPAFSNMDAFEPSMDMSFVSEGFLDDLNGDLPSLGFTPSYDLEPFSATFEDPFSYQAARFDSSAANDTSFAQDAEPSFDDLENKLLSFSAPLPKVPVLELDGSQSWPAMSAELNGMFFVAEDVFGSEAGARPMELTCYRRNLFQISGTVVLSRSIAQILDEQGNHVPIYGLQAILSAVESIEGKLTEIITVPWKSNAAGASEDKAGSAPPKWPLDLSMNPELDPAIVSIPIAWKRLQFKHATANNGRRKGLQQHYVIQINLMATLATGEVVQLSEIRSNPIIVRGRNPGNFGSGREVALSDKKSDSKQRSLSSSEPSVKVDPSALQSSFQQYSVETVQPLDLPDWNSPTPARTPIETSHRHAKRPTLTPRASTNSNSNTRPPIPETRWTNDTRTPTAPSTAPIDLSFSDDLASPPSTTQPQTLHIIKPTSTSPPTKKLHKPASSAPHAPSTTTVKEPSTSTSEKLALPLNSPTESEDLLYEYFPLSIDDWMPPVDAIYRPHVVHHTAVVPDAGGGQMLGGRRKVKRYFSAGEDD